MSRPSNQFWVAVFGAFLAVGWLLPNNSLPWLAFHKDTWVAAVFLLVAVWVFWSKRRFDNPLHGFPLVALVCSAIVWIQYYFGMIPFIGAAWIQSLYLLGFAVAFQVGLSWERFAKGESADFVFFAFVVSACLSTCIQIYQWLGLRSNSIWILNNNLPDRFYANISQPNLLGSLLLLGVMGCAWGFFRQKIPGGLAVLIAAFLLFGVVLTGSRTAWLNIIVILLVIAAQQKKLPHSMFGWLAFALGAYFFFLVWAFPFINDWLYPDDSGLPIQFRGVQDGERIVAWRMLIDAMSARPWAGFGWGQVAQANLSVVLNYPPVGAVYTHAHNIVLDLILWNGVPLGVLLVTICLFLAWQIVKRVQTFAHLNMLAVPLILGVHAMLEFPLQYAYFLLPMGLMLGAITASVGVCPIAIMPAWLNGVCLAFVVAAFSITVRDYFRVEASFYGVRFEERGIPSNYPKDPPDVIALTHLREAIIFARNVPQEGLDEKQLQWMRNVVYATPSTLAIYRLAGNLAVNNRTEEAAQWLKTMCMVSHARLCPAMKKRWLKAAETIPAFSKVALPSEYLEK